MGMNIGNHGESAPLAYFPQAPKIASVETNDASVKAVWIEIVIKHKIDNLDVAFPAMTKEKRSAFPRILLSALPQPSR
jgi:hypothetical protein